MEAYRFSSPPRYHAYAIRRNETELASTCRDQMEDLGPSVPRGGSVCPRRRDPAECAGRSQVVHAGERDIGVSVRNGEVELSGRVEKLEAKHVALSVKGVKGVA